MSGLTCCIFLIFLHLSLCKDCIIDNRTPNSVWEYKLHEDLQCNYHIRQPPVENRTETVKVAARFMLKYFSFDQKEELFTIYSWVFLEWDDYRLKWDPAKYDNINEIQISSMLIWTPGLKLFNTADENEMDFLYCLCLIESTGHVKCIPRVLHVTDCSSDLTNWPYDTQKCTFKFGEWSRPQTKVVFTFNGTRGMSIIGAEYGSGWNIIEFEKKEDPKSELQLELTFVLERQALGLASIVVIPCLVVSVLTMASLILGVRDNIRLGIICFSLFIHYALLTEIGDNIPRHSVNTPLVLLFMRSSILLTVFVIILTLFLSSLSKREVAPPTWINALNAYVFKGYLKYTVWPRWQVNIDGVKISEDLPSGKSIEEWTRAANILNSLCIFVLIIVYLTLYLVNMPKPLPSTY